MAHRKLPEEKPPRKGIGLTQILVIIAALCAAGLISFAFYAYVLGG